VPATDIARLMHDSRPNVRMRLIEIDETLRGIAGGSSEDFRLAYGVSPGDNETRVAEVVNQTLELYRTSPRVSPWGGYLAADLGRAVVVGTCGFVHGPDTGGSVEIAYYTFPPFESRGYASAMARELLALALSCGAVRDVVAHTLPEVNASTRVLEKAGFRQLGEARDPEVGRAWRWVYQRGGDKCEDG